MYPIVSVVMWLTLIPIVPVMNAMEEQSLSQLNIDTGKLHKHNTTLHMTVQHTYQVSRLRRESHA